MDRLWGTTNDGHRGNYYLLSRYDLLNTIKMLFCRYFIWSLYSGKYCIDCQIPFTHGEIKACPKSLAVRGGMCSQNASLYSGVFSRNPSIFPHLCQIKVEAFGVQKGRVLASQKGYISFFFLMVPCFIPSLFDNFHFFFLPAKSRHSNIREYWWSLTLGRKEWCNNEWATGNWNIT